MQAVIYGIAGALFIVILIVAIGMIRIALWRKKIKVGSTVRYYSLTGRLIETTVTAVDARAALVAQGNQWIGRKYLFPAYRGNK